MAELLGTLWDKGGASLVILAMGFVLLKFMLDRGVKSFDSMATAQLAAAAQNAAAMRELVAALHAVGDRLSKIEGKVEAFGIAAIRAGSGRSPTLAPTNIARAPSGDLVRDGAVSAAARMIEENFDGPTTGTHDVMHDPRALPALPRMTTPGKGVPRTPTPPVGNYSFPRAGTKGPKQ